MLPLFQLAAVAGLVGHLPYIAAPPVHVPEAEIKFSLKADENPSSKPGQIRVPGTHVVRGAGNKFTKIQVDYRPVGTKGWALADHKKVTFGEKDGKKTWSLVIENPRPGPGEYEVKAQVHVTNAKGRTGFFETEPARRVTVKGK